MASQETEGKLRIADALVVIALAVVSFLAIWRTAPEALAGVLQSLMPALLVVLGGVILIGKTRAGRLVRTRRRWKYFALMGVAVALIIVTVALTSVSPERPGGNLALGLFPAILGLFVAQLYEPEESVHFRAADLSDRDAKTWARIAVLPAVVGIVLGCIAGVTVAAGDTSTGFLLLPIAILFLVFATAIWIMLKSRNRQLRAKP
ncbi:hypothetical protein [Arthrobacter sp. OY3WO11]|uniref:hypothetical protein n=1 Tax=Arthrobacter sp. OY3WO11 TaxID=1835723 RepID=UPI0007D0271D|nr:hypothetical protein [Arthrobacter sp. OY3WO11]OAE01978.1 hypothetical protein A6A22_11485 [Arthrobacter sp. OY3WO11]